MSEPKQDDEAASGRSDSTEALAARNEQGVMKMENAQTENSAAGGQSALSGLVRRCRTFEVDHEPLGWPAIQMQDVSALCDAVENLNIFKFDMGQRVMVTLAGSEVAGEIVSRCQMHTGGNHYAVFGKYKHATQSQWFSEKELVAA